MRRLRFIPALLVILSACSESVIQAPVKDNGVTGTVKFSLTTDMSNEVVGTKAGADEPELDEFRVAVYKAADRIRLYNDSYANTVGKEIKLNAGSYRLVAQHGDTLGCGFDKPYYLAEQDFTVEAGVNTVSAVAKLANVKLAVEFDETISLNYTDYYAIVRHNTISGKNVKFKKNETRCGYIPGGEVVLEVYADVDGNGTWKYFKTDVLTYAPNDFVTFEITTDDREGSLVININVDGTVDPKDEVIEIPAITVPQDAPSITLAGFDAEGNIHEIIEGQDAAGHSGMASFLARGSLVHCYLTVESDWLAAKGVPSEIDFASVDASQAAVLKAAGFAWDEDMATSRTFSYIDFSDIITGMLSGLKAEVSDVTLAKFSLRVVDSVGKDYTEEFSIVSGGVSLTLDIKDYNVWAAKVESPVVTMSKGVPSLVALQASVDGINWIDIEITPSTEGYTLDYGTVPAAPGTTYDVRAIYNGNENCVSPVVRITTEEALQLGNSGFEDYQTVDQKVNRNPGTYTRHWYLPYASGETDPWWACNSKLSMPSSHTYAANPTCKNFPTSGYVKDTYRGNKAAMIFTADVSWDNTANSLGAGHNEYEGELWIGTANDDGERTSEGHAFASRPSKLSFYYKYSQKNSEHFYVNAWVKDADGNIIATAQETEGPASDNWKNHQIPFNYTVVNKKAASIFVLFRSCTGEGEVTVGKSIDLGEESFEAHIGSMFKIDELELIYE